MEKEKDEAKKSEAAEREERVLAFWEKEKIFKKSLEKPSPKGEFVFYEGPPTANGKPGIHHLEARAFKDVINRYKTMQGYHVRRKGGWDTHGLPVELQVEKKLGLTSKKAVEEYGIAKFNKECKESVWEYLDVWRKFTTRIGFWVDQENPYVTYHNSYIESLWYVLKTVEEKGLLYKDYKVVPWCPRCGTALSSHELAQGYEDVKDISVYVKFKITNAEKLPLSLEKGGNVYLVGWTTTPWTLPGNVALAVGEEIEYITLHRDSDIYIISSAAHNRLGHIFPDSFIGSSVFKGKELLGLCYEPLYPYTKDLLAGTQSDELARAYKVYPAKFVTTTDGTGVVHTAVMYGADDFELGTAIGLPKHHLVALDGTFVPGTGFLEGRFVRDEGVAVDIIKDLAGRGLLQAKEKYAHSYPHCWRCKTALVYYARDSWYIRMSSLRDELVKENQDIHWEPEYIRDGRFGEWLKEIKDWAISRERYWGTPLPIWTTDSGTRVVIGSLATLRARTKKSGNTYYLMRHGEAETNVQKIVCGNVTHTHCLTERGKKLAEKAGEGLKEAGIEVIISSPILRTKETARVVAKVIGMDPESIVYDERLKEVQTGVFEDASDPEFEGSFKDKRERYTKRPEGGESAMDVKRRVMAALYEYEKMFNGKRILIVTHADPLWLMREGAKGKSAEDMLRYGEEGIVPEFASPEILDFVPLPHNEEYELDLHRPYIDELELISENGEALTRVKEVMDVWFDSGAMPFAQDHYPFGLENIPYPADFISEAIDQTRGWFYTLHAVGILMGRGKAFKNVICLGHILDEKGKKMSKSLGNIVDPWLMMEKYGVDTLRLWMYSINQPGEPKNFDEKTVAELHNKFFNLLYNVLSFYEMYAQDHQKSIKSNPLTGGESPNVLDAWIVARLDELTALVTRRMEGYQVLEPVRAMREFIDDFSTWYVRRSRDRLRDGDAHAVVTLRFVLATFARIMAPFAPFAAEDIWHRLRAERDEMSVHMTEWPTAVIQERNTEILETMRKIREIVSLGLQARSKASIKVRQPLGVLKVRGNFATFREGGADEMINLIKDEVNVKKVVFEEGSEIEVWLDTTITEELRQEGEFRELMRTVQDSRKTKGLQPQQIIRLLLPESYQEIVQKFEGELKKGVRAEQVLFTDTSTISLELL